MRFPLLASAAALVAVAASARPARAFDDLQPTDALGMGGASRAWAAGDAGPLLNPSGMTLVKSYTLEGTYGYASRLSQQFIHTSIVDDTSSYGLAGGLYYTYHDQEPGGLLPSGHGHEFGLSLALPFGPYVALGATLKYFLLYDGDVNDGHDGGLTFDIGATVRPISQLSIGLVGSNLRSLDNSLATQAVGYGVAFIPLTRLMVMVDGSTRLTADNQTGRKGTSVMGGGSYTLDGKVAFRLGGGYDAATGNAYGTVGLSGTSDIGALAAGFREDLSRSEVSPGVERPRETMVGVSLRLFIPASQTTDPNDVSGPDMGGPMTTP